MEYPSLNTPPAGSLRFNTDSSKMEIYNGDKWWNIDSTSPDEQTGGTRGLVMGGGHPNCTDVIEYANIDSTGNFADFGDLTAPTNRLANACFASRTRGFAAGGGSPTPNAYVNKIEYVTISSTGDGTDFGHLSGNYNEGSSVSNSTRGVIYSGYPGTQNIIDYITMASAGNAQDFGDKTNSSVGAGTMQSPTRGVYSSGETNASPYAVVNSMVYLTIATTGNTADFGDAARAVRYPAATSNAVRGVQALGGSPNTYTNAIEYITIATLGDAIDFGDLVASNLGYGGGGLGSPTRAVFVVGNQTHADYIQIMSTGNAVDFGNLLAGRRNIAGASNGHGGLG